MTAIGSARDRLAAVLERWAGRPTLFAVAVMNVITGLGLAVTIFAGNFGVDSGLYRRCAVLLAEGQTDFCGFLYSPLTAVVARPLTWISPTAAMVAMSLIGIAVVVTGVVLETRGHALVDRLLVAIAALSFAPTVHELLLGQTTLLIAAAIYPLARRADAFRNGIPFGIALALAPKPLVVPVLIWLVVWRRQALAATVLTTLLLTGVGMALLGVGQYQEWIAVLSGAGNASVAGSLSLWERGNFSLWPLNPVTFVIACVVGIGTLWAILRDSSRGFVASLFAGLLLAPYSQLYAFSILLLAVRPALEFAPRTTRVLALIANVMGAFLGAMTAWSLVGLTASASFRKMSPAIEPPEASAVARG
ncbi:MAG: DUF2029 domain-containing protein [Chloroflexi bacterium]|nr:DUF2029 domain-containing protein [Chloroflexota bacterium]